MPAAKKNFVCEVGSDWARELILKQSETGPVINLTGYTFRLQIRDPETKASILLLTVGSGLALDAPNGKITLSIPAIVSSPLRLDKVRKQPVVEVINQDQNYSGFGPAGIYDLEVISGVNVTRLMTGLICFVPEQVTQ